MKTVRVLGVRVDGMSRDDFRSALSQAMRSGRRVRVSKLNTEFLLRALRDPSFARTLDSADINIADGRGVLWAAHYLARPVRFRGPLGVIECWAQAGLTLATMVLRPQRIADPIPDSIPGTAAFLIAIEAAVATSSPVFLFGGRDLVVRATTAQLEADYPALKVGGIHDGYSFTDADVIDAINASGAQVLFVALGSPAQERWIESNIDRLPGVHVAIGEGGTFDFIAGEVPHAPSWMRRSGLEWAWRLITSPSRTGGTSRLRRVWDAVPVFIAAVVGEKVRNLSGVMPRD